MPVTGTKKVVKPEKFGGKTGMQFCIDAYLFSEVMKSIPANVRIFGARVAIGETRSSHKIPIPNALRKHGVIWMRQSRPAVESHIVVDEVSKEALITKVKKVCEALNIDYAKAYVKYITLANAEGVGRFSQTTKEIRPNEEDLRKKLRVLGLTSGSGKVQGLIAQLGAKKYTCDIQEVTYRIAICRPA